MQFKTELLFSFLLLFVLGFTACKKDKDKISVSGVVTDSNNNPVASASVVSAHDSLTTDAQGKYSIEADANGTLRFSKGGDYEPQTVNVNSRSEINIVLQVSAAKVFADYFAQAGNQVLDPGFSATSIKPTVSAWGSFSSPSQGFFASTNYKGAVDPSASTAWYEGWSFYSRIIGGQMTSASLPTRPTKTVSDADMRGSDTIRWVKDTTYILSGFVFVNNGQVLDIQEGTIIQGVPGTGANSSALIIATGGKILAEGTASEPIIFTYQGDQGNSAADLRGQWGGLIVLGKASLNSSPGQTAIEGIPTNEARGLYGGSENADNSGVLRYVSLRHGGANIGADNEINGLTLGGVGSGTTIEYVEVIGNDDDGIEWFGGTVNGKYLISAYCQDDAIDYDEGYRGLNQYIIVHQDPTPGSADRGGEHDGGTDPETAMPYATPIFYNVTMVGNPSSRALTFRDNAGGEYHNSIFTGFGRGVDVENLLNQEQDSYKQFQDGLLKLENNIFFNIAAGSEASALFTISN